MSSAYADATTYDESADRVDNVLRFYRSYYKDEILALLEKYPDEQNALTVDWGDLHTFWSDLAEDYLVAPGEIDDLLTDALEMYDAPVDITLDGAAVRVVNIPDDHVYTPLEVTKHDPEGYVGVSGKLAKATTPAKRLDVIAWECQRCGTLTEVPQSGEDIQDPGECSGCERKGPYEPNKDESQYSGHSKIRVETPPSETGDLQDEYIDGVVSGELVFEGHEHGVVGRTGDSVTVYGTVELRQKHHGAGKNERLFDEYIDVDAINYDNAEDELNPAAYRDEFEALAARDDAVDVFAESLVPELYATPEWESALEMLVAYLFGSPRIDVPHGPTYRGDIHMLVISDYGMGKSMVNSAVAEFAPKSIKESVTGMSSDVGLLAAAVEDDFGDGQWSLQPGILVRANGGHVILDEIDKTDANLERMNDAMEGEQLVDVNKAGKSATFKSRVGVLATGNPPESRFDKQTATAHQMGLDESFLSRFDGIVTMMDAADEEQDADIAETQGLSYIEAQEYQQGERDDLDRLDAEVSVDLGRNWIHYARENVNPLLQRHQVDDIKEWYASEVRQLNKQFASNVGEGGDMPVPANSRTVMSTIRCAVAFARVKLQDEVTDTEVERAKSLVRSLVGQNFDGERFVPVENQAGDPQVTKMDRLTASLPDRDNAMTPAEIATTAGVNEQWATDTLEKLAQKGEVLEPRTGVFAEI